MVTRANGGVMRTEPIQNPDSTAPIKTGDYDPDNLAQPPAPVAITDGFDFDAWMKAHKDHLADEMSRAVAWLVAERCGELKDKITAQQKKIEALQLELATMKGAVDTLRGRNLPGMPAIKGTYASGTIYNAFDIVALGNSSFIARRDNPGLCPGPDWQLLAGAGRRGPRGERGPMGMSGARGLNGLSAPTPAFWSVNRTTYTAVLRHVDGSMSPPLELRGLFEQFITEVSRGTEP
jgi:hypothetical protein